VTDERRAKARAARSARQARRARIAREEADIELIVSYLNGHLDAEQAEKVRRRLSEDREFFLFAEPLLITWSVPSYLERHPRPPGELEAAWAEFVRRTGFPNRPAQSDSAPAEPPE